MEALDRYLRFEQASLLLDGVHDGLADAARDAMDFAWEKLTGEERDRLNGRSLAALSARRAFGQHWLEVAAERMLAGEPEEDVMRDYGWERKK
jgi:hypothetical protein